VKKANKQNDEDGCNPWSMVDDMRKPFINLTLIMIVPPRPHQHINKTVKEDKWDGAYYAICEGHPPM